MVKKLNNPRYSIIVPVYGVEAYLPQAIESVLSQSVSDWELILVDDGSKDRCPEICDHYASLDQRIHVIHKENGGLVSARQEGIKQCRGEYVLQLDGDDFWNTDLLRNIDEVVVQYQPDCILFSYCTTKEDGIPIKEYHNKLPQGLYSGQRMQKLWEQMLYDPQDPNINGNTGAFTHSLCTAVFRRQIVTPFQLLVPQQIHMGEDAAVTIPAVCGCKSVYALDKAMYQYRLRNQSMVRTFNRNEIEGRKYLIAHLKAYGRQLPSQNLNGYIYQMMEKYWIKAARNLGSYQEFKSCAMDSFQLLNQEVLQDVSGFHLKMKYRMRVFIIRNKLLYIWWLFYRR